MPVKQNQNKEVIKEDNKKELPVIEININLSKFSKSEIDTQISRIRNIIDNNISNDDKYLTRTQLSATKIK